MSKFAAALKEKTGSSVNAASKPEPKAANLIVQRRGKGQSILAGISPLKCPNSCAPLRSMEDTTVQDLLAEALNMLFQSRGLPMIAAISREQATSLTSCKPPERLTQRQ